VLKIPLLLHWPAGLKSRRVSEAVGLVDLAPTLLDLAGLPPMASVVGSSLAGLARGGVQADRAVLAELNVAPHLLSAVVQGQSKLITRRHGRRPEYFDLRSDPGEQRPLPADTGGALSGRLRGLLNEAEQRALEPLLLSPSDVSPAMEEQLRQLGYID
jgi:arylsulfatase A-like enzyme